MPDADADGWVEGRVQIYTGDGKGKTTAALGLTVRAVGAGFRVFLGQFLKGQAVCELAGLQRLGEQLTIERFGSGRWIRKDAPIPEGEIARAKRGMKVLQDAAASGTYRLVIADEILGTLNAGLIELPSVLELVASRHASCELVLTGRNAPDALIEAADLVSEIKCIKHYYQQGVPARRGIEK